ncbi:MAG: ATP-binding protein, partial [Delftia sp.]|nr:ATP-binding protein [Delftia sp.]
MNTPVALPLVGRQREWQALQSLWKKAANGEPRCVLIKGEAGIGKTRLAEELLSWANRQGITTAASACYAAEGQLPYAPIADWLRSEDLRARLPALEGKWRTECARLLPELLAQQPDLPAPGPLTEAWQRQHLFTALAHAVLSAVRPIILLIDDLQWCDQDT